MVKLSFTSKYYSPDIIVLQMEIIQSYPVIFEREKNEIVYSIFVIIL